MFTSNPLEEAMGTWEAHYKRLIYTQTWGHLYPDKPQYKGKIRVACSLYGSQGTIVLDEKNLPESSPWWFESLGEFVSNVAIEPGEVAEIDIQVDIVNCIEELEDWQIEEGEEPKEWSEIQIKQLRKATIVKAW